MWVFFIWQMFTQRNKFEIQYIIIKKKKIIKIKIEISRVVFQKVWSYFNHKTRWVNKVLKNCIKTNSKNILQKYFSKSLPKRSFKNLSKELSKNIQKIAKEYSKYSKKSSKKFSKASWNSFVFGLDFHLLFKSCSSHCVPILILHN